MSVRISQHESPLSPVIKRCMMLTVPAPATATEIHPQGSEERTHATSLLGCAWVLIDPAGLCYPAVTLAGPPGACGHGTPSPALPSPSAAPGSLQPLATRVCPWLQAGRPPAAQDKSLAFRTGAPPFNTAGFHLPAPKSVVLVPHHLLGNLSAGSDAMHSTQRAHPRGAHRAPPRPQPTTKDPRRGEQSPPPPSPVLRPDAQQVTTPVGPRSPGCALRLLRSLDAARPERRRQPPVTGVRVTEGPARRAHGGGRAAAAPALGRRRRRCRPCQSLPAFIGAPHMALSVGAGGGGGGRDAGGLPPHSHPRVPSTGF